MNAKKSFVAAIVLSTVLLAFAASFWQADRASQDHSGRALTGPPGKFGPVVEVVLPAAKNQTSVDILDLETGHALLHGAARRVRGLSSRGCQRRTQPRRRLLRRSEYRHWAD